MMYDKKCLRINTLNHIDNLCQIWRISKCIIRGITATVLFIDQVEGEVSGDKNEKTLYELINCEA